MTRNFLCLVQGMPRRRRKLPTSGAEPTFSDKWYGSPSGEMSNNCYAYAIDARETKPMHKLQPGELSNKPTARDADSCAVLMARAASDNAARGFTTIDPGARCPRGSYKIMGFIDPRVDFHWMRQNGNVFYRVKRGDTIASIARDFGVPASRIASPTTVPRPGALVFVKAANVWSHKLGLGGPPLLRDGAGRIIDDPRSANRKFGSLDYTRFCGAACVRRVKAS